MGIFIQPHRAILSNVSMEHDIPTLPVVDDVDAEVLLPSDVYTSRASFVSEPTGSPAVSRTSSLRPPAIQRVASVELRHRNAIASPSDGRSVCGTVLLDLNCVPILTLYIGEQFFLQSIASLR